MSDHTDSPDNDDLPEVEVNFLLDKNSGMGAVAAIVEGGSPGAHRAAMEDLKELFGPPDIEEVIYERGSVFSTNWDSKHPKASKFQPSGSAWRNGSDTVH